MKNRYKEFVLEAEEGITFEVSEGTGGELIIKAQEIAKVNSTVDATTLEVSQGTGAELISNDKQITTANATVDATNDVYSTLPAISAGEYAEELSVYTDKDGNKAVVLPGWTVSGLSKENTVWGKDLSLVIYRIPKKETRDINWESPRELELLKRLYSQLVWCPVELLDADGTLDGKNFTLKFGIRNHVDKDFSKYHKHLEKEFLEQKESVEKYGGFYITRYDISIDYNGKPQSVKGAKPYVKVDLSTSRILATDMAEEEDAIVKSHLTYGAEYDSVLAWLIKSDSKKRNEIFGDSTHWGNYWNTSKSPHKMVETGSREEWCANNIYDFAGNVKEWTQEFFVRGGHYNDDGDDYSINHVSVRSPFMEEKDTGFRAAYYIE